MDPPQPQPAGAGVGFTWEGRLPEEGRGKEQGEGLGQDGAGQGRAAPPEGVGWPSGVAAALPARQASVTALPPPLDPRTQRRDRAGPAASSPFRIGCQQLKARGRWTSYIVCQLRLDRWVLG